MLMPFENTIELKVKWGINLGGRHAAAAAVKIHSIYDSISFLCAFQFGHFSKEA